MVQVGRIPDGVVVDGIPDSVPIRGCGHFEISPLSDGTRRVKSKPTNHPGGTVHIVRLKKRIGRAGCHDAAHDVVGIIIGLDINPV